MRSTQQLINTPFEPGSGLRLTRLAQLEEKHKISITPPDRYVDADTKEIMERPCNIKPVETIVKDAAKKEVKKKIEATDHYIDQCNWRQYETHPLRCDPEWKNNWINGKYTVDVKLSECIEAWLLIEEIKYYRLSLEANRKEALQQQRSNFTETEARILQASSAVDMMLAAGREHEEIPAALRSQVTGNRLMTLPVKLDGVHIIDFQELLDCQPILAITEEEKDEIIDRYHHYFKQCQFSLVSKLKQEVQYVNLLSTDTLSDKERQEIIDKSNQKYEKEMRKLKQRVTLEWFTHHVCKPKPIEYLNPLTNQPVQSIQIEFNLLKQIDNLLNPLRHQINIVHEQVAAHTLPLPSDNKSYARKLEDSGYPVEKIPEALALGQIPGNSRTLEVMTHPVLLDGERWIDFERLKTYWENRNIFSFFWNTSRHGYNPFTGQLIKTIQYDSHLKKQTDNFMKSLTLHRALLTEKEVQSGYYIHPCLSFFRSYPVEHGTYISLSPAKRQQ